MGFDPKSIIGNIAGSAIGKVVGKVVDFIPSPRQYKRKQLRKLQDEIKQIQSKYPSIHDAPSDVRAHYELILHKASEYAKELEEE